MAVRLSELAKRLGARLLGEPSLSLSGARSLHEAGPDHLSIVQHPRELKRTPLSEIRAGALICSLEFAADHAHEVTSSLLVLEDPYRGLVDALGALYPEAPSAGGISPHASVDAQAHLEADVHIGPFAVVGRARLGRGCRVMAHCYVDDGVEIGEDAWLAPGCVVLNNTRIGAGVRLQPGVVVGADGFGYAPEGNRNIKVPQVGGVRIEDDVEIGANACVDRGALSDTVIGRGSKLDDLVLVGHGAELGSDVVLVGQVGLAGGVLIGSRSVFAGQAGVAPFIQVGEDARIGARGGVTRDMPARAAWSGMPAIPHQDWLKSSVRFRSLETLHRRCQQMETDLASLRGALTEIRAASDHATSPQPGLHGPAMDTPTEAISLPAGPALSSMPKSEPHSRETRGDAPQPKSRGDQDDGAK